MAARNTTQEEHTFVRESISVPKSKRLQNVDPIKKLTIPNEKLSTYYGKVCTVLANTSKQIGKIKYGLAASRAHFTTATSSTLIINSERLASKSIVTEVHPAQLITSIQTGKNQSSDLRKSNSEVNKSTMAHAAKVHNRAQAENKNQTSLGNIINAVVDDAIGKETCNEQHEEPRLNRA